MLFAQSWSQRRWRLVGELEEYQEILLACDSGSRKIRVTELAVETTYPTGMLIVASAFGYDDDGKFHFEEFDGHSGFPEALVPFINGLMKQIPQWPLNPRYPGGIGCRRANGCRRFTRRSPRRQHRFHPGGEGM